MAAEQEAEADGNLGSKPATGNKPTYNKNNNSTVLWLATRTQAKTIDAFVRRPNGGQINSKPEQLLGFLTLTGILVLRIDK